jgi:hypothetical protein
MGQYGVLAVRQVGKCLREITLNREAGIGGDAGAECFVKHKNGTEIGWQAKYIFGLGATQVGEFDDSLKQAF